MAGVAGLCGPHSCSPECHAVKEFKIKNTSTLAYRIRTPAYLQMRTEAGPHSLEKNPVVFSKLIEEKDKHCVFTFHFVLKKEERSIHAYIRIKRAEAIAESAPQQDALKDVFPWT